MKTNDTILTLGIVGIGAYIAYNLTKGFQGIGQGAGQIGTTVGETIGVTGSEVQRTLKNASDLINTPLDLALGRYTPAATDLTGLRSLPLATTTSGSTLTYDLSKNLAYAGLGATGSLLSLGFSPAPKSTFTPQPDTQSRSVDYGKSLYSGGNPQIYPNVAATTKAIIPAQGSPKVSSANVITGQVANLNVSSSKAIAAKYKK